jgi:hypothetical protein
VVGIGGALLAVLASMDTDEDTWVVGPRLEESEEEGESNDVGTSGNEGVAVIDSEPKLDGDSELLGSVGVAEGLKSRAASVPIMIKK